MTITQAYEYIYQNAWENLPKGLERLERLLAYLGNPQRALTFIHVAGTNGKGSVCAMMSQILMEQGYRVGMYTSPYIERFNERIQINRQEIGEEDIVQLVQIIQKASVELEISLSVFDILTCMAILYFSREKVEYILWETGMGGRLDGTNVIDPPLLTILTRIGMDHQESLGDTLLAITKEKAGIIKEGTFVVTYPQEKESLEYIQRFCAEKKVEWRSFQLEEVKDYAIHSMYQEFSYKDYTKIKLRLQGQYQISNALLVLEGVEALIGLGVLIERSKVYQGLEKVTWKGRFEIIHHNPYVVLEGAHNRDGIQALVRNLEIYFPDEKVYFILGMMKDKDYHQMIRLLVPKAKGYLLLCPDEKRGLDNQKIAQVIRQYDKDGEILCYEQEKDLLLSLRKDEIYICTGSLYLLGKVRSCIKEII